MLLTHKILSKLRDPLGRKKLGELRYKVYRLEGLLELVAEDPLNAWLYRNRVERMDATVEIYDELRRKFHLARYEFACKYVRGMTVVDAACGTGYGSGILKKQGEATAVTGIDLSSEATDYAKARHGTQGVSFVCASADQIPVADDSTDAVISFETIEHVKDDVSLLEEFWRILKPGGLLICSTPNNWPVDLSQHHLRSYDLHTFRSVLERKFIIDQIFNQNSGSNFEYNHDQKPGIQPTTVDNQSTAECFIAVCRKPNSGEA